MTIQNAVTHQVTYDLLTQILSLLPSVSQTLSKTQKSDLVKSRLCDHKTLKYASNNDLGLCVDRLVASCEASAIRDASSLETRYTVIRDDDDLVSETMEQMASGFAGRLTTPLHDLRVTLPREATQLAGSVTDRLPIDLQSDDAKVSFQYFNWGKLNNDACRAAVLLFARDRINCFKRDTAQSHDTDAILRAMPFGSSKPIPGAETLRPTLLTALQESGGISAGDPSPVVDLILSPKAGRQWFAAAKASLSNNPASAVATLTNTIDFFDDTLQRIDTTLLTQLGGELQGVSTGILDNIEMIVSNIQLLRGAMLYHKEKLLTDKLLLSPSVVQKPVFDRFVASGGTEDMISDYVSYTLLIPHLSIPKTGLTPEIIIESRDRAAKTVREQSIRLRQITAAKRAIALQNTLSYRLDQYNDEKLKADLTAMQPKQSLHKQQKQRALALLAKRPLDEIALEYIVALRDDPLIKPLHAALHKELLALVERESTVTKEGVATATCNAIITTVLELIQSKFCSVKA